MSPKVFWGMSVKEFMSAFNGFILSKGQKKDTPMGRSELEDLMTRFPD